MSPGTPRPDRRPAAPTSRRAAGQARPAGADPAPPTPDTPVQVLIVDDQPPFRLAAAAVLDSMPGFTVAGTAETGEEAVALAETLRPQLVLMDVVLPRMSGLEATRRIRRLTPPPVVVLVSTYDASDFGDDVERSGADAYLAKSAFGPQPLEAIWLGRRS